MSLFWTYTHYLQKRVYLEKSTTLCLGGCNGIRYLLIPNSREQLYFQKVHHSLPMIDQVRFYAMFETSSGRTQEFTSLRLAIQMTGASVSENHSSLHEKLYQQAREGLKEIEIDDTIGSGMGIEMIQAWTLIAVYEFRQMLFSRAVRNLFLIRRRLRSRLCLEGETSNIFVVDECRKSISDGPDVRIASY